MKKAFILIIFLLSINTVNAESVIEEEIKEKGYYINAQNVTIDEENYNKIKDVMTDEEIDEINSNYYKNLENDGKVLQRKTIYYETYTYTGKTGEIFTTTKEISKEEYKKSSNTLERGLIDEHTTTYKKITLEEKAKTASQIIVDLTVEWKQIPQHRSYDILAIRTSSNQIMYNYSGFQDYKKMVLNQQSIMNMETQTSKNFRME